MRSSSSVVTPGATCAPTSASACAAIRPATRIRVDGVGVLTSEPGEARRARLAADVLGPRRCQPGRRASAETSPGRRSARADSEVAGRAQRRRARGNAVRGRARGPHPGCAVAGLACGGAVRPSWPRAWREPSWRGALRPEPSWPPRGAFLAPAPSWRRPSCAGAFFAAALRAGAPSSPVVFLAGAFLAAAVRLAAAFLAGARLLRRDSSWREPSWPLPCAPGPSCGCGLLGRGCGGGLVV